MEDWDQEMLEKVVAQKNAEYKQNKPTKISLEEEIVSETILKLVSMQLWHCLSFGRFQMELCLNPHLIMKWKKLTKREAKEARKAGYPFDPSKLLEVTFHRNLIEEFLEVNVNLVGLPARVVPCGFVEGGSAGLPVSLQMIGSAFSELDPSLWERNLGLFYTVGDHHNEAEENQLGMRTEEEPKEKEEVEDECGFRFRQERVRCCQFEVAGT